MGLDKFEIWVHDHILKNDTIRHFCYGVYQRLLYLFSKKFKKEGDITVLTPDDGYEYLFGYYDKNPWNEEESHLLALKVKSASAKADSTALAEIVLIPTNREEAIKTLATTHCWNVQQGCMLQWFSKDEILYNDFRNGAFCAVILNLTNGKERLLPMPIYTLSPDKRFALTLDFTRLHRLRPGYGYANLAEKTKNEPCPDAPAVWRMEIDSGAVTPLFSYRDLAHFESRPEMENAEHKVNHLMISPDGKRFMLLHRWFYKKKKYTRLVTADTDGTGLYNLSDDDFVSHCCWKNNTEIVSYLNRHKGGKGYYLLRDKTTDCTRIWQGLAMDGHPSFSPDGKLAVTDTYPDRRRIQSLYVMEASRIKRIARVFSPFKYGGDTRCDLHPRFSRKGDKISFDAAFTGKRSIAMVKIPEALLEKREPRTFRRDGEPPIASIIIPCYNAAPFLNHTLSMLENQTCRDFEVILVNDGSGDETAAILKAWQEKGSFPVTVIEKENGGVSSARNCGIAASRGKYILFLDADDAFEERYVEMMIASAEDSGAEVAYCRLDRSFDVVASAKTPDDPYLIKTQTEAMRDLLYRMGEFAFCTYAYRRDILQREGITFDENTRFGEDREFNWKYLCHVKRAAYIDMPLYWYRPNPKSATRSKATYRKTDLLSAVDRTKAYLEKENCPFSEEFYAYMYHRSMWAVAKTFAVSRDRALFKALRRQYNVRASMKKTAKDKNKLVKLASIFYLIHPMLFYFAIGLKG